MRIDPVLILVLWLPQPEPTSLPNSIEPEPVRKIIAALVDAAGANQKRPEGARKGDELASYYIRQAIQASLREKTTTPELLVALGIGLDSSNVLRDHAVAKSILEQFESDAERKHRLKVLGRPTMKGRPDWLLHFALCAALTGALDAEMAEQAGIYKEVLDSKGGTGFSFADLAADYAGIHFAQRLLKDPKETPAQLARWSKEFRIEVWLPRMDDFEEGLSWKQVRERFGGFDDPRLLKACRNVRDQVLRGSHPERRDEPTAPASRIDKAAP